MDPPDRDAPFRHLSAAVKQPLAQGRPVISVDTTKKELIGNYRNADQQWRPAKEPSTVQGHDRARMCCVRIRMASTLSDATQASSISVPIRIRANLCSHSFAGGGAMKDVGFMRRRVSY